MLLSCWKLYSRKLSGKGDAVICLLFAQGFEGKFYGSSLSSLSQNVVK
jgi:hypothetical protein